MSDLVILRFDAPWGRYQPGDSAGFLPGPARRILETTAQLRDREGNDLGRNAIAHVERDSERKAREARKASKVKPQLTRVRFFATAGRYQTGDVAAFSADVAKRYAEGWRTPAGQRKRAVAAYVKDEEPEPEKPAESEEPSASQESANVPRRRGRGRGRNA
jgi:hypothetical protein